MTSPHADPTPVLNYSEFIAADGDDLTTTSQLVAFAFGKRHADVLRAIANLLLKLPKERQRIFALVACIDAKGESRIAYRITRDGFSLLAMGFTGDKALAFKLAYLDAFNAMAAFVRNQREGLGHRRNRWELEKKDSERRGSYHGRGLNERKQEIPALNAEGALLLDLTQPALFVVGASKS